MNLCICYMQTFILLGCQLSTVACKNFLCRFIAISLSLFVCASFRSALLVTLDDEYIIKLSAISPHLHIVNTHTHTHTCTCTIIIIPHLMVQYAELSMHLRCDLCAGGQAGACAVFLLTLSRYWTPITACHSVT